MPKKRSESTLLTQVQQERLELLRERSTEPFVGLLDKLFDAAPTPADMAAWATKHPAEWGALMRTFAQLAGYSEKHITEHRGVLGHVVAMSDSELVEALQKLATPRELSHVCQNSLAFSPAPAHTPEQDEAADVQ